MLELLFYPGVLSTSELLQVKMHGAISIVETVQANTVGLVSVVETVQTSYPGIGIDAAEQGVFVLTIINN